MPVNFAIFGDVHGQQHKMYQIASEWSAENGKNIDAILQVGDFETIIHPDDSRFFDGLPGKAISDISEYVQEGKQVPVPTYFIGGNHEAWSVLKPYNNGGHISEKLYYIGRSGIVEISGYKIGGLTGLYNFQAFDKPLPETPNETWKYYRKSDIEKISSQTLDILLLHEWISPLPNRKKSKKNGEIIDGAYNGQRVSPAFELMIKTNPKYVFMGHTAGRYLETSLNGTKIYALNHINGKNNSTSFTVISLD